MKAKFFSVAIVAATVALAFWPVTPAIPQTTPFQIVQIALDGGGGSPEYVSPLLCFDFVPTCPDGESQNISLVNGFGTIDSAMLVENPGNLLLYDGDPANGGRPLNGDISNMESSFYGWCSMGTAANNTGTWPGYRYTQGLYAIARRAQEAHYVFALSVRQGTYLEYPFHPVRKYSNGDN